MSKNTFGTTYKHFEDRLNWMIASIDKRSRPKNISTKRTVKVVLYSTRKKVELMHA